MHPPSPPRDLSFTIPKLTVMSRKSSDHVKAAKARSEEHILRKLLKKLKYVREKLTSLNEYWVGARQAELLEEIRRMVKEKTGREMQKKATPLKEGVVLIKAETTMADLQRLAERLHQEFGVKCIQIGMHKDEGHWSDGTPANDQPSEGAKWLPNLHAHMVWDWMNHKTGKSYKLKRKDMSRWQDIVAEELDMERGHVANVNEEKRKHLDALEYKIKANEERLRRQKELLRDKIEEGEKLEAMNAEREEKGKQLDAQNAQKENDGRQLEEQILELRQVHEATMQENKDKIGYIKSETAKVIKQYNTEVDEYNAILNDIEELKDSDGYKEIIKLRNEIEDLSKKIETGNSTLDNQNALLDSIRGQIAYARATAAAMGVDVKVNLRHNGTSWMMVATIGNTSLPLRTVNHEDAVAFKKGIMPAEILVGKYLPNYYQASPEKVEEYVRGVGPKR